MEQWERGRAGKVYLTSPWRRIKGALGYISINSLGRGYVLLIVRIGRSLESMRRTPLGPVSADVDRMTGMSKTWPMAACAMMLFW
jgi:hypothetical protein